ncbi:MAG: hypothetical protein V3W07_05460 [Syntrophobacteria bacterium]
MDVLPGVLGCRTLRRTVQVRLRSKTLWLPGSMPIFTVSRLQFMKCPGYALYAMGPNTVCSIVAVISSSSKTTA